MNKPLTPEAARAVLCAHFAEVSQEEFDATLRAMIPKRKRGRPKLPPGHKKWVDSHQCRSVRLTNEQVDLIRNHPDYVKSVSGSRVRGGVSGWIRQAIYEKLGVPLDD